VHPGSLVHEHGAIFGVVVARVDSMRQIVQSTDLWAAIAPELAGHVAAIGYDTNSGQLTVCPESTAWATKTRLEQTRVIEAANKSHDGRGGTRDAGYVGLPDRWILRQWRV
jgi:hypothetical protein